MNWLPPEAEAKVDAFVVVVVDGIPLEKIARRPRREVDPVTHVGGGIAVVVDQIVHDGVTFGGSKPYASQEAADIAPRHPGSLDLRPRVSVQVRAVLLGAVAEALKPKAAAIEGDIAPEHEAMPCAGPEIASHDVVGDHGVSALASDRPSTRSCEAPADSDAKDEEKDGATGNASSHRRRA